MHYNNKDEKEFPESVLEQLRKNDIECNFIKSEVVIKFDNLTNDQALDMLLPSDIARVKSFERIGHIGNVILTSKRAHLNLLPEHDLYKKEIGRLIIEKNPGIRTVVNKMDKIDTTFRFFAMELIAGEYDMLAKVKEENCIFEFDFSKVYWNSRLQHEHKRLVDTFKPGDLFAGVGPFAIPAGKKECIVYANDLNPESFKYLQRNIKLNKFVHCFNMDAKEFIAESTGYLTNSEFDHYIMNLPASATSFLKEFNKLTFAKPPTIHCYLFAPKNSQDKEIVEESYGKEITGEVSVHQVRSVAPNKDMFCCSFRMPKSV
ncbi:tRNA transferase Trm5/Tyw2 domain-containing protein [Rozella allomycis CSF55]|uniref:tRNA (guanine(37)-N1)-methyltransferase n=1 Tax=Rozella allomycis (strain CSF55) TaxID=988480 RepID=A0A075ATB1_ROZAC|nr:tRNA transferase Trm5/Tyw2 domain-containing protein [Rozella allomycis CSF55]|eukprot:EPZ33493.1 tRNA transferase Trm5/Tyw2 domain-containing protein [Rozella allomycis CSF55]